ncbi:pilus assembly protein PilM [Beggiatoa leptomitoformis]|uniref:Type IV pilus assembly protein PilM n=1 Tax=Beggiatoa leptomitoformis TaxID=288004 RepID=A0A2N9YGY9_9GAMM|nr:pilus assembly protein PilM [Beggiatoa leptomitoformis]ALG67956.1 type IV pilus assembly protein PilM [Beggiatoa leptomitoformis]AUI69767.1 type IV pilus assembly protein PilM [Beggiatoa leptomitoformis]
MGIFSLKPEPLVGIDISSTAVKLLELSRAGNNYKVESYAIEPLPEKAVEDKNVVELETVGEAISRVVRRAKPKAQFSAVAVSGPAVITKIIEMDKGMSDDERRALIEADAEQYIPYPLDEISFDFEVIGPNDKDPETRMDVLLAASRSENVEIRIASAELGGLKVRVVDIEKYALENAFRLLAESDPEINVDETIGLVDVGATTTTINVLGNNKIVYSREELFGGKRLTENIQHRYGISYEEANLAKRNGGLPDDYEIEVLEPFKAEMAQQISRMVQYYYSSDASPKYGQLSHILIAGGCASIPGIIEHVSNKVGGHVTIANPFASMSLSAKVPKKDLMRDAPALMIACGLALRTFDKFNY